MKKALLFIGLAMCTSIAFAQTNNYAKIQKAKSTNDVPSINLKELALEKADYKASIFTKDAGDTLACYNFENTDAMTGILYANNGLVGSNEVVNGTALTPNGNTNSCARWQWIQDTNYLESAAFVQTYALLGGNWHSVCNYFKRYLADDGGFMLMTLIDLQPVPEQGTTDRTMQLPHAYVQFPTYSGHDLSDRIIDVRFTQIYRNFYDQCFIDYKVNGAWKTREINVDGIDCEINDYASVYVRYVMPVELGTQTDIDIRIRYRGGERSNAYGYFWGIDNFAIVVGGNNRMLADAQDWAGGAYGTVPMGMQFPLSWWTNAYNGGYYPITNGQLQATHIAPDGTENVFATTTFPTLAPGDATDPTPIYFNEQGLLYTDSLKRDFYYYYYMAGAYSGGHYMDTQRDPSLQYRSMPTDVAGRHRVAITANADSNVTVRWDTIAYRVVDNTTTDYQPVEGYRWGHDNGIIAAGSGYHVGYTISEGHRYISEDEGSWDQNGYGVYVRYTTGPEIPVDANGDPWVLRGVEIVTSPEHTAADLNGARLRPVTLVDYYDADETLISFPSLDNGVNEVTFTLNGGDVNNTNPTGVGEATQDNYQAVNIFFPMQPELEPNTSYRVGYQLTSSCTFSAAATSTSYRSGYGTGSDGQQVSVWSSYDSNVTSAPWRSQFWANNADVLVKDPLYDYVTYFGAYYSLFPMIRAIVGPREPLDMAEVNVLCENEEEYYINYNGETECGNVIQVPETSGPTFVIVPGGDHMVLDSLFIDEQYVPLNNYDDDGDDDFAAEDYSVIDTLDDGYVHVYLERSYWTYTFRNISAATHSIRATAHYAEWAPVGIDPVSPDVRMHLNPNPATSQVALSIKGVEGMVNCSVIDMSGRTVYSRQINAENTNTIDLSSVPAGAYFVRITNDTFSKVEKLIVR